MTELQRCVWIAATLCSACGPSAEARLRSALEAEYGGQTRVEIGFVRDRRHLQVLLDGPTFDSLSDALVPEKAVEIARRIPAGYPRAAKLQEVTVRFVRFVPEKGRSWCFGRSTTLRMMANPESPDQELAIAGVDFNPGPCLLQPSLLPPVGCTSCIRPTR
ncbi:MAG TPA: hypothetical protein VJK71_05140 [Gemmatimonadales bacterium]|nr:hypothetical protein [Gemmatimonadales bacterium]